MLTESEFMEFLVTKFYGDEFPAGSYSVYFDAIGFAADKGVVGEEVPRTVHSATILPKEFRASCHGARQGQTGRGLHKGCVVGHRPVWWS